MEETVSSSLLAAISGVSHGFEAAGTQTPAEAVRCHQVHGRKVVVATPVSLQEDADGLITSRFQPVAVVTADCLPILMSSDDGQYVAAVHGGWRGLNLGVIDSAVAAFSDVRVQRNQLRIAIGPAIRACCYEVGEDVIGELHASWSHLWRDEDRSPPWSRVASPNTANQRSKAPKTGGGFWLDLVALAIAQFNNCGVDERQIEVVGACTYCGPGAFASYRRNKHEAKTNRSQFSWIGRRALEE
ncbi:polyphenol oxidase family protein [Paraburkholderia solisilvae]|uniref:Polyphenol oxidase n=1 Tax=Paraburkholderia solisilvae TaxID=624376 RepID=A0A6J5EGP9_9BURK|nr:polyphenol oxidase family protein [Paraburkholderia solisilvae]CAB3764372.1 Polyphenol oxidase [Paraburkholderia solisilvae]